MPCSLARVRVLGCARTVNNTHVQPNADERWKIRGHWQRMKLAGGIWGGHKESDNGTEQHQEDANVIEARAKWRRERRVLAEGTGVRIGYRSLACPARARRGRDTSKEPQVALLKVHTCADWMRPGLSLVTSCRVSAFTDSVTKLLLICRTGRPNHSGPVPFFLLTCLPTSLSQFLFFVEGNLNQAFELVISSLCFECHEFAFAL